MDHWAHLADDGHSGRPRPPADGQVCADVGYHTAPSWPLSGTVVNKTQQQFWADFSIPPEGIKQTQT